MKIKNNWIKPRQNRELSINELEEIVEGIWGKGVMGEVLENMGMQAEDKWGDNNEERRRDKTDEARQTTY